jgi:hypothetical protein
MRDVDLLHELTFMSTPFEMNLLKRYFNSVSKSYICQ